jgi:hypothetical protein
MPTAAHAVHLLAICQLSIHSMIISSQKKCSFCRQSKEVQSPTSDCIQPMILGYGMDTDEESSIGSITMPDIIDRMIQIKKKNI